MSWRDRYRQGSWRGVPFRTSATTHDGGRRGETHEFPGRDKGWREDLGGMANSFTIECWTGGPECDVQADALAEACARRGPGTLIHPFLGSLNVALVTFSRSDSAVEGGIVEFSLEFVETTETPASAAPLPDTAAAATDVAGRVKASAVTSFAGRFDVSKVTGFVEDAAVSVSQGASLLAQASAIGGTGDLLRAFEAVSQLLPDDLRRLVRSPIDLAQSTVSLVGTLSALMPGGRQRVAAMRSMTGYGATLKPVIGETAPRRRQRTNQSAYVALVTTIAAAELVIALADSDFASADDARAARDDAAMRLDVLIARAADGFDDDSHAQLVALRAATITDLTARGGSLARVYALTPSQTVPALVLARRVTEASADIVARAEDLVARNRIRHPGFVPGGSPLDVLSEVAA